jgi:hypothetical protein
MDDETHLVTTDEAILNSMGEGDEQTTDEGTEEQTSEEEGGVSTASGDSDGGQSADGSNAQQQQPATHGPQDLVDGQGNLIATGGKERRFYETAQREKARAEKATSDLASVQAQLDAVNSAGTLGTQYSLSPEELTTGAQIMSAYKDNPVETIQYMLTQAQSQGYNVEGIINGAGTDMGAIKQMIDNSLAPILGDRQRETEQAEANRQATEIYNNFSSQHPDAAIHEASLSRLLQEDSNLNVEGAYLKLQNYYLQKGLDWTKSLDTLQAEYDASKSQPIETQPQPPEGGSVPQANVTDKAQVADVSISTEDIIRQAMADAGM